MAYPPGFKEVTATVTRGEQKTDSVGTLSVHIQGITSDTAKSGAGIMPAKNVKGYFDGLNTLGVKQGDIFTFADGESITGDYSVTDIRTQYCALFAVTFFVLQGEGHATS
jgi:hypothetical protein